MNSREQEYKEMFIAEALEIYEYLSRLVTELEKSPEDESLLAEIFRLLHNLKANSKAMDYTEIAEVSHKMETAFSLIRNKELSFSGNVVNILFDGIDVLNELIAHIDDPGFQGMAPEVIRNLNQITDKAALGNLDLQQVKRLYNNKNVSLSDLIYIRIKKLDDIMNLVGELIIDKDRITAIEKQIGNDELRSVVSHLHRVTSELQAKVMDARLVNIGTLFNKFPRIIRDVAIVEDKSILHEISGHEIQIDRNILQVITDSLIHIVRNAVSHGIESPEMRTKKGKPAQGTVSLSARNDKDNILIIISDDGDGIEVEKVKRHAVEQHFISWERMGELNDAEVLSFIFEPGFSLSEKITEMSGRGVGLDVVKNAIDLIGGKITIQTKKGEGTSFHLNIPTSMAVKAALLFEVNTQNYAIPLLHTDFVSTIFTKEIHQVGATLFLDTGSEIIPLIHLAEFFLEEGSRGDLINLKKSKLDIIVVSYNNTKVGLIVDKFLRQQDIVVKALHEPVQQNELFGGVTLLGNGEICLVMDVPAIVKNLKLKSNSFVKA